MQVRKSIVTNVNAGYIPLLENMRYFLKQAGLLQFLHVYSVGRKCKRALDRMGIESVLIEDDLAVDTAVPWATANWKRVSYQKIRTIRQVLDRDGEFLYADPDIIFQKDVFAFLENLPDSFDIYGQDDHPNHPLCSGFMYIRDNATTRQVFSIPWEEYDLRTNRGDQVYINGCKDLLRIHSLPRKLFLNGIWFQPAAHRFIPGRAMVRDAYIVHYNYTGKLTAKYERMQKNQHLCPKLARRRFPRFVAKFPRRLVRKTKFVLASLRDWRDKNK